MAKVRDTSARVSWRDRRKSSGPLGKDGERVVPRPSTKVSESPKLPVKAVGTPLWGLARPFSSLSTSCLQKFTDTVLSVHPPGIPATGALSCPGAVDKGVTEAGRIEPVVQQER